MIFTLLLFILIIASSSTLAANECVAGNYRCVNNGKCIPNSWMCDRENDCGDNSDEQNCPTLPAISTTTPYFFPTNAAFTSTDGCNPIDFMCLKNGKCIYYWLCDGINDCDDNRDEQNCINPHENDPTYYKCLNKLKYIPKTFLCDDDNDCGDNSDEQNCPKVKECKADEFKCLHDGRCIPNYYTCDEDDNCGDNSDEMNCTTPWVCKVDEFKCLNIRRCIPKRWLCDRSNDCNDFSDERNCPGLPDLFTIIPELMPTIAERCNPIFYFECKSTANCIDLHFACNGEQDCQDNSDETDCSNCKPNQFRCMTSGRCIFGYNVCDNYKDCDDNSDEANCTAVTTRTAAATTTRSPSIFTGCAFRQFQCLNGNCIANAWKCDKQNDCGDNSDEQNCRY